MNAARTTAYESLIQRERERALLNATAGLLGWDERTYMPRRGVHLRGDQMALLARLSHERLCEARTRELLLQAEEALADSPPEDPRRANLRGVRRQVDRAVKIPSTLVEAMSRAVTLGQQAWEQAKQQHRFADFAPHLQTILKLKREEAAAVGFAEHPYDALLDEYEPGMTVRSLRGVLADLRDELVPLLSAIIDKTKSDPAAAPDVSILERSYPVDRQKLLCQMAAASIGFDFQSGRLDETAHPFCSGQGPGDVRLTTRYNEHHFSESFFGTLHEAGHGLYEQNLPAEHFGTPLGQACSLGIHESQSRLWENQVGRSRPFWDYFYPLVQRLFPESLGGVDQDAFYRAINDVRPSFIRIEADEVTYNLHILLRFELELALISGELHVEELPAAWNEKFKAYFQMTPHNDALGCLQDIHWSAGLLGYFPTYTLGNLYAAQFMAKAKQEMPDLEAWLQRGSFQPLCDWLKREIHLEGQRFLAPELGVRVTGETLSHRAFIRYLKDKYSPLYGLA